MHIISIKITKKLLISMTLFNKTQNIKVLHLNFDDDQSGASKAVYRIHSSLIKRKIESSVLVVNKYSNFKNYISFSKNQILINFFKRFFSFIVKNFQNINSVNIHRSYNFFDNNQITQFINNSNFDVIHIHWINGEMLSIDDIIKIKKPIVWTLHDLWPVLPTQHIYNKKTMPALKKSKWENYFLNKKKHLFQSKKISIVCPSEFVKKQLPKWFTKKNQKIKVIPNTIDFNKWKPNDVLKSRRLLNLPVKNKFLTFHLPGKDDDFIKGTDIFVKILKNFKKNKNIKFITFGSNRNEIHNLSNNLYSFGFIKNSLVLKNIYNASDLVISTSRFESFGQVMLEANSCGVTCIGNYHTAVREIINNNKNILVKNFSSKVYQTKIEKYLKKTVYKKRKSISKILFDKFNENKVAESYVKYYKETIKTFENIN